MRKPGRPDDTEAEDQPTHRPSRRAVRTLAMQLLYEIDLAGGGDRQTLLDNLMDRDPAPDSLRVGEAAVDLALAAWQGRGDTDPRLTTLAPDWPPKRQPPVDRAILRLACHEMRTGHAPPNVAINEAVELAKRFGAEPSHAFINGVLDQLAKRLREQNALPETTEADTPRSTDDDWLDDALDHAE